MRQVLAALRLENVAVAGVALVEDFLQLSLIHILSHCHFIIRLIVYYFSEFANYAY